MRLRITVEDQSYDVGVEALPETPQTPQTDPILELPESVFRPPCPTETRAEDRICRSPIAGLVVSVNVQPSQRIRQNDPVLVIEAMKMQNTIQAPLDGVLEEIHVAAGQTVKSGQPLFRVS